MSKNYYNYMCSTIIKYFEYSNILGGRRFLINLESLELVNDFYEQLEAYFMSKNKWESFEYTCVDGKIYNSFCLKLPNNSKLLVARESESVNIDFLTFLRNLVGQNIPGTGDYSNLSVLILSYSKKDSIDSGTEDLQREGMPLHYSSVKKSIESDLNNNVLQNYEKLIIKNDLDDKAADIHLIKTSLDFYKVAIECLQAGFIEKEEYKNFGLFYDDQLKFISIEKKQIDRINLNKRNYSKIDSAIHDKNIELIRDIYDNKLIKKLEKKIGVDYDPNWAYDITFQEILDSIDKVSSKSKMYYNQLDLLCDDVNHLTENYDFIIGRNFDEAKHDRKKKKDLYLYIFKNNDYSKLELNLKLNQSFSFKEKVFISNNKHTSTVQGKNLNVSYNYNGYFANRFELHDKEDLSSLNLNVIYIPYPLEMFEKISGKFKKISIKNKKATIELINIKDEIRLNTGKKTNPYSYSVIRDGSFTVNLNNPLILDIPDKYTNDDLSFDIVIENTTINFKCLTEKSNTKKMDYLSIYEEKLKGNSFSFDGENVNYVSASYQIDDITKKYLKMEQTIISMKQIHYEKVESIQVCQNLNYPDLDIEIQNAYYDIIEYYRSNDKLPSLTSLKNNDELIVLYANFIKAIENSLTKIHEDESLNDKSQGSILFIGTIYDSAEKKYYFSPLNPLSIYYQLYLNNSKYIIDSKNIKRELLSRFNSIDLLPYFYGEDRTLYKSLSSVKSMEWKEYGKVIDSKNNGSLNYVSELVREKIKDFVNHFSFIFELNKNTPIKLNFINLGSCKEVFEGVVKYYIDSFDKAKSFDDIKYMEIHIYNTNHIVNEFEKMSNSYALEKMLLNMKVKNVTDISTVLREKVHYYLESNLSSISYAHISFYEMFTKSETTNLNVFTRSSGTLLYGLQSSVPSAPNSNNYATGFGLKDSGYENNNFLKFCGHLNTLARYSRMTDAFKKDICIATEISNENKALTNLIYDKSYWVNFIDPKVDLSFFTSDSNLLIIHYSDQYTNSSGYDSITVTQKSKQYLNVIKEYLNHKNANVTDDNAKHIINVFNALNGDWLLRLISSSTVPTSQFSKEKISILAAAKLMYNYLNKKTSNVAWIPMSLEEVIRISGAIGLKPSEGLLSAYSLGINQQKMSDDLLFVGVNLSSEGKTKLYFYPVEVKIGTEGYAVSAKTKALEQVAATKEKYINDKIKNSDDSFTGVCSRVFLAQNAYNTAIKMDSYHVINNDLNTKLINDFKCDILNDNFVISNEMDLLIGKAGVVVFSEEYSQIDISVDNYDMVNLLLGSVKNSYDILKTPVDNLDSVIKFKENAFDFVNVHVDAEIAVEEETAVEESSDNVETEESIINDPINNIPDVNDNVDNNSDDTIVEVEEEIVDSDINDDNKKDNAPCIDIKFGNYRNNPLEEIHWYPNDTSKVFHPNTGIIGTMGTGKTQFTLSLISQLVLNSKYNVNSTKIGVLIFDYKGDYNQQNSKFVSLTKANVYESYKLPFNPFQIPDQKKKLLPLHVANGFKETVTKAFNLGAVQENTLLNAILEAYKAKGIVEDDESTWNNPSPTFKDVYEAYMSTNPKIDSLTSALQKIYSFKIFEEDVSKTKSLFDLIDGITVIDIHEVSPDIQNLIVAITLDLFYTQMQCAGHSSIKDNYRELTKFVLVDEADNFLQYGFPSIKKILKEGREFGVGTILSTQFLSHFDNGDDGYSKYINTWIIHKVPDISSKDIKGIFSLPKNKEESTIASIKTLSKHCSITNVNSDNNLVEMRDKPFFELYEEIKQ